MTTRAEQAAPRIDPATQPRFQTDQVLTVAAGHFVHDGFSAFIPPLLPIIQERLGTGYAVTGSLAIFIQLPSLLNPFIGHLADRVSLRYFIILAPAFTGTLCSLLGLSADYLTLAILLFAAGLSVAAFHAPAPAMIGRLAGPRIGTGMSIFMASGELGRSVGPLLIAAAVTWWGLEGIWRLAVIGWICSIFLYWRLHAISARPATQQLSIGAAWPQLRRVFPVLTWILLAKAFLAVALTTYLPTFMADVQAADLWLAAASLSLLEGAGVVGALLAGTFSDWLGRSRVLLLLLAIAPLLFLLFLYAPTWALFPLLLVLGFTVISPTPVILALVQDYFPDNRALANGILMAVDFIARAVAIGAIGWMADSSGLQSAFVWSGALALLSVPGIFFLPKQAAKA